MPLQSAQLFFRQWLRAPLQTGSVLPSGLALTRELAKHVDIDDTGIVLELGPGTGPVTRALLERGVAPERLVLIERSPEFVDMLRRRYPQVQVLCGDAQRLDRLLADIGHTQISQAVSSLPLRSLPIMVQHGALRALTRVLAPGGSMLQFTYGLAPPVNPVICHRLGLRGRQVGRALWNVPPAQVWSYRSSLATPLKRAVGS